MEPDTPGTSMILGTVKIVGKVHGALNTIVQFAGFEGQWMFRQFVSDAELERFLHDNSLQLIQEKPDE